MPLIDDWFASRAWSPFGFQRATWKAYQDGQSGLIHAATGTGKTYAVWMSALSEWIDEHPDRTMWSEQKPPGLRVLWVTPLRALASDTENALLQPVRDLALPWIVESRTGDTTSTVRGRQRRRLPTALVTTPESLSLLLANKDAEQNFRDLRLIVVDEWHELMSSKRGTQTELALARLRRWRPSARLWGLSATMGNLDVALRALIGTAEYATGEIKQGVLIQGQEPKAIHIDSIIPPTMERFPWAGHLGLKLLDSVIGTIQRGRTSLVFTNTRAQTEIWYQAILDAKPEWAGEIALHHGSLDKASREWVENGLREGKLRCVVCTSSLDLGVDFAPVDVVIQVGSPKGVGRLLQRTGRSGHQPGAESRVTCAPTHAFEYLEIAAVRDAASRGIIEARPPIEKPLDVLSQHLVTVALGGGFVADELFQEVRTAYAYRQLTRGEFEWTLDFVARGGNALHAYPEYSRIVLNADGRYQVDNNVMARTHRMSIGTILGDATLKVQFIRGAEIGFAEENFLARLQPGDKFTLGGKVLEFVRIRDMKAWVRAASSKRGIVPRWFGGSLPISSELTQAVREKLDEARAGVYASDEMRAIRPILELQAKWSTIPSRNDLLIERVKTREGNHLFVYPFEGRLVHEGMASLIAYRVSRMTPITFTISVNDYGFELLSPDETPLDDMLPTVFSADNLADDIAHSLNASELAKRQFREIARIAGLVIQRFPGGQKSAKQLQASSSLLYDVFTKYDPDNLLLHQAYREVLERQLEINRLQNALEKIMAGKIILNDVRRPTPFAFPLLIERVRQTMTSEALADRVRKMTLALEKEIIHEQVAPKHQSSAL